LDPAFFEGVGHTESVQTEQSRPHPLGATVGNRGTNFAVRSRGAERMDLCLFDRTGAERRIPMTGRTGDVWHVHVPVVGVGQRYGYRAHGRWDPASGARFNSAKLLLDPYARAIDGAIQPDRSIYGHRGDDDLVKNDEDSALSMPRCVVVDDHCDWRNDRPPRVPWESSVLYELHVKGFTACHPRVPEKLRGSYAGLAHPAVIKHLTSLGVTAVELLPIHHFMSEPPLADRGLVNYWGYNTVGYFAPHAGYSSSGQRGGQVIEFQHMVRDLHAAGIEVILDVVYNHTAETAQLGPTLNLRGLDNAAYYRLSDGRYYLDTTGCGNSLDSTQPEVVQLIADSLRYWVTHMHVDGFRLDLATTVFRGSGGGFDPRHPLLMVIAQDPILSQVKFIAEPWDVGNGGYQLGHFPEPWAEWNDRYRDSVRDFWLSTNRGARPGVRELASRLAGSSDIYTGRGPLASINFVTSHDGFTLRDLTSYNDKHNEANQEDNRDGTGDNRSWNSGAEGDTSNEAILTIRRRLQRAMLATMAVSTGVPMLTAGDEFGRSQQGNNNAYCQDTSLSWLDWQWQPWQENLLRDTQALLRLRREHPVLRQTDFFDGRSDRDGNAKDLAWFAADGTEITGHAWDNHDQLTLGMFLSGTADALHDASFFIALHAGDADTAVRLPRLGDSASYRRIFDTAADTPKRIPDRAISYRSGQEAIIAARTVAIFEVITPE
jgi:isoamylase